MEFLNDVYWRNPVSDWLVAVGVAVGTVVVLRLFKGLVLTRLERWADRTRTRLDNMVVKGLQETRWFFYGGMGIWLGAKFLRVPKNVDEWLDIGATVVLLLQIGVWSQHAMRAGIDLWARRNEDAPGRATMAAAVGFLSRLAIWSIVLLLILSNVGIEISALIAGLGVGGIAAALALQNVLGDLFASLSIYFDRPFDIGDFIIVGEFLGTVDRIGLRSTRITSLGGEQLIFSNSDLLNSRIRNYKRMKERRAVFHVGIQYNTPYERVRKAKDLLQEAVEEVENVRFDRAHFKAYGEWSLQFETVYWILDPDYSVYMDVQEAINLGVYRRFEEAGIRFAFPSRTIHMRMDTPVEIGQEGNGRDRSEEASPAHH